MLLQVMEFLVEDNVKQGLPKVIMNWQGGEEVYSGFEIEFCVPIAGLIPHGNRLMVRSNPSNSFCIFS